MATQRRPLQNDVRRPTSSPRPKVQDKDTMCRNVLIYGHCRYVNQGCAFRHEQNKPTAEKAPPPDMKKALNVESPSFTPASLSTAPATKKPAFSSAALASAVFTPRSANTPTPSIPSEPEQPTTFNPAAVKEFTPSINYDGGNGATSMGMDNGMASYDPFSMNGVGQTLGTEQYNPYAGDHSNIGTNAAASGAASAAYYTGQNAYAAPMQPLQYHLYAPSAPYKQELQPFQRTVHDFFLPEKMREELDKKAHAILQVMPNIQLPQLDNYHSLVPLDTSQRKNTSIFGFPTWVYKATSTKTGRVFCLRRLEGFRLSNENAIRAVKEWKRIDSSSVVSVVETFTTRAFGDSSLVFAQEYFPLSQTLTEAHHTTGQGSGRYKTTSQRIGEQTIWTYIVQISNALKAIHSQNLAARCLDPSKIIMTDKNRIRLDGCGILDVVQYDSHRPVADLQQEDFMLFGKLIIYLATGKMPFPQTNLDAELDLLARSYSNELKDIVTWLLSPSPPSESGRPPKNVNDLVHGISHHILDSMDQISKANDNLTSDLTRELENGRLVRLVLKLGTINERYEYDSDPKWSENAERYLVKLFRDYVFHSVDDRGRPVVDIGHMIRALNKLDAGSNESMRLTSRDGESDFIITYKEMKKQIASAFADLTKHNRQA